MRGTTLPVLMADDDVDGAPLAHGHGVHLLPIAHPARIAAEVGMRRRRHVARVEIDVTDHSLDTVLNFCAPSLSAFFIAVVKIAPRLIAPTEYTVSF